LLQCCLVGPEELNPYRTRWKRRTFVGQQAFLKWDRNDVLVFFIYLVQKDYLSLVLGNEILREFGRHKAETQLMMGDITPCKPRKKKSGSF
jgi:hypothetical protein